jgi:hypothetical protein
MNGEKAQQKPNPSLPFPSGSKEDSRLPHVGDQPPSEPIAENDRDHDP